MTLFVSRPVKLGILLFAGICIYEYHLNLGTDSLRDVSGSFTLLPLCFFFSEIMYIPNLINRCRYLIFYVFISLGLFYVIFTIFVSPNMGTGIKYIVTSVVCRYMLPLYALFCIRKRKDVQTIYRIVFVGVLIMTFWGFINLLSKHSVYVDWLLQGEKVADYLKDAGSKFAMAERFRVQGTFSNPFDYGYTCIALFLFYLYGYNNKIVPKYMMIGVAICSLFGIMSCNCRTILLCAIVACLLYVVNAMRSSKYLVWFSFILPIFIIVVNFFPYLNEKLLFLGSMFDTGTNYVVGSTIDMRVIQFISVMGYIKGHELTGRGIGFFSDLGFADGTTGFDNSLGGLEGSYLQTLLETGMIGTILYFSIILTVLIWAWRKKKDNRISSAFLLSLFSLFLLFGILTGELKSAYITFLLSGFAFYKILVENKKRE